MSTAPGTTERQPGSWSAGRMPLAAALAVLARALCLVGVYIARRVAKLPRVGAVAGTSKPTPRGLTRRVAGYLGACL